MTKMKKLTALALACALGLSACAGPGGAAPSHSAPKQDFTSVPSGMGGAQGAETAQPMRYRSMWFSYLEWPMLDTSSAGAFTASVDAVLDNCVSLGLNCITVQVRPGVLIPRPETEVLVSEALALLPAAPKRVAQHAWPEDDLPPVPWPEGEAGEQRPERTADQGVAEDESTPAVASGEPAPEPPELLVADLCTGSGCIACSVAYEHPLARVVATDIVPEAVAQKALPECNITFIARDNVAALELGDRVEVLSCDLGEGVDPTLMGAFDLVVSNPPYVPTAVMDDIPREVAEFEPALALDGGADGLDVLRRLLPWCRRALKEGGGFAFELHETCLDDAARLAAEAGFVDVRTVSDLAGRPRVLAGRSART